MRPKIFALLIIATTIYSCAHSQPKPPTEAIKLNDSAFQIINRVRFGIITDSAVIKEKVSKAIILLNKALSIDSSYYIGLFNKFDDEIMIHEIDSAKKTGQHMINAHPNDGEIKVVVGSLYTKIGDSSKATTLYNRAIENYNLQLTLLSASSKKYKTIEMEKAMALILLGRDNEGHEIMNQLYNDDQTGPQLKATLKMVRDFTKHDILYGKSTSDSVK